MQKQDEQPLQFQFVTLDEVVNMIKDNVDERAHFSAARLLVDTVNVTGGLIQLNGHLTPVYEDNWIDLAAAYLKACEELNLTPKIEWNTDEPLVGLSDDGWTCED